MATTRPMEKKEGDIDEIKVWDKGFHLVKTIHEPQAVNRIEEIWVKKESFNPEKEPNYMYSIDIISHGKSTRWRYDPAGYTTILSKARKPVFRIQEAETFNKMIIAEPMDTQQLPLKTEQARKALTGVTGNQFLSGSNVVQARLNEDEGNFEKLFGAAVNTTLDHGFTCKEYKKNTFTIKVWYNEHKAVKIEYVRLNAEKSTIDALIKKTIKGNLVPVRDPAKAFGLSSWNGKFFKSEDGKYVANIYGSYARIMTISYFSLLKNHIEQEEQRKTDEKKRKADNEAKLIESF